MYKNICTIYLNEESGYESLSHVAGPVKIVGDPNCVIINDVRKLFSTIIKAASNKHDNHEVVKSLIQMGAYVNVIDYSGSTALHHAALDHKLKITKVLLQYGVDVNRPNRHGDTALHAASFSLERERGSPKYENDLLVIKALLQKKANVNARNINSDTPLMEAVRGFHLDIVKELLEAGADVNARNTSDETCLHVLFESYGRILKMHGPLSKNGDVTRCSSNYRRMDIMIELIKAGAPLQAVDKDGRTPLKTLFQQRTLCQKINEDITALIKTALLVKEEEKENYYAPICCSTCCVHEINIFIDQCHAEVQEMRIVQVSRRLSLCDFALHGGGKSKKTSNSVYEVMMKNTFKIYDDYIAAHFEREYLCGMVVEKGIFTRKDPNNVVLLEDVVIDVCKLLSNTDLFNLLRGSNNCLPHPLK